MTSATAAQADRARRLLALHVPGTPLLLPNPWDRGTAMILASLGFAAVATTSGGLAVSRGGPDGTVSRADAVAHGADLVDALATLDLPVSADLEDCFADDPGGVAETVRLALAAGLAGCSIEDAARHGDAPIVDAAVATARVAEAARVAHTGPARLVLTARAENHLHGRDDLGDTIARLLAYQDAGADVLYAPGLVRTDDIKAVVDAVDRPVNVLCLPGGPTPAALARLGVSRISLGSTLAMAAHGALARSAARLLAGDGPDWDLVADGRAAVRRAFGS